MTIKDRVIARYKAAEDDDDFDLGDAVSGELDELVTKVEPDVDDIVKMVKEGIDAGCNRERERSEERSYRRYSISAMLEWASAEVRVVGKNKLRVTFPPAATEVDGREGEREPVTFEITVERTDR